ncbi:MAG: protocatechuate 3,4-dioxygenase [Nitrosomonas sp.]|nr:protocatechuate 3,4-dioxygenase [Nitrosomonas sp.]
MRDITRRKFIKSGVLGGIVAAGLVTCGRMSKLRQIPTPPEVEGPFYPTEDQDDKDYDLTQIEGHKAAAAGTQIIIVGRITDLAGNGIDQATIDIWQANTWGRYHHPRDPNPQPLDPNFQGWAIISSDTDGNFRFKTVMPGAYPASETWTRPPHIHFKVSRQGYDTLITQMYFPNEKLNETDYLLSNKKASERPLMIARNIGEEEDKAVYEYNIVLIKI